MSEITEVKNQAVEIAAALGTDWHTEDGQWTGGEDTYLCGPNGEQIHMMVGRYRVAAGRAELTGSLNHDGQRLYEHIPYGSKLPSITVSLAKSPQQIARDIERRLLPTYREIRTETLARKARSDQDELDRQGLAASLAAVLGVESENPNTAKLYIGSYGDPLHGDVSVRSASYEVEFSLRASPSLAIELAKAIAAVLAS